MNQYQSVIDRLNRGGFGPGKPNGKETRFRCPAHDDANPSLDISEGRDGKALFQCRSQHCSGESILKALDLKPGTNGHANSKPARKIVATYPYRDEKGVLLFEAVRFDPKGFAQRKPLGAGQYEWSIAGCRKVPYRLPELLASEKAAPVFVCEGEKDCDALARLGLTATCNAMGAGNWKLIDSATLADAFRGRIVVVCPDNDKSGREYARTVAESLLPVAAGVWVCELPGLAEKGDVSDWLAAGGTKDKLLTLADQSPTATKWMEKHSTAGADVAAGEAAAEPEKPRFKIPVPISHLVRPPKQQWLWEGFLKVDGISLLSALWKVGKTTLLSRLLLAFGRGGEFLGLPIKKSNVLYVTEENEGEWVDRRDKLGIGDHVHVLSQPWDRKPTTADWNDWLAYLADYKRQHAIGFTCLDTVSTFWPIKNENDASEVNEALMPMRALAKGQSVCVVHHLAKFDRGDGTGTRGSGALCGFVDVITEMRPYSQNGDDDDGSGDDRRRVLTSRSRWDETPRKLVVRLRDDGLDFEAEGDGQQVKADRLVAELVKLLPAGEPGVTADDVHEALPEATRPKRGKVMQALQSGAAVGDWQASGSGRKGDPRRFWKAKNEFRSIPFQDAGTESAKPC